MPLDYLEKDHDLCAWCNVKSIPTLRHKYCGKLCRESAYLFCYPQGYPSKGNLLMKQHWACTLCGLDYEEMVRKTIKRILKMAENDPERLLWNELPGIFYPIGHKISGSMDLDHIKPIHKGGVGLGNRNHQVICRTCHRRKTSLDRR